MPRTASGGPNMDKRRAVSARALGLRISLRAVLLIFRAASRTMISCLLAGWLRRVDNEPSSGLYLAGLELAEKGHSCDYNGVTLGVEAAAS